MPCRIQLVRDGDNDAKCLMNSVGMEIALDLMLGSLHRPRPVRARIDGGHMGGIRSDVTIIDVNLG